MYLIQTPECELRPLTRPHTRTWAICSETPLERLCGVLGLTRQDGHTQTCDSLFYLIAFSFNLGLSLQLASRTYELDNFYRNLFYSVNITTVLSTAINDMHDYYTFLCSKVQTAVCYIATRYITFASLRIEPNSVMFYYCSWFDF